MRETIQVVRMVGDPVPRHLPLWFPDPIFDDESRMPVSPTLLGEIREWNKTGSTRIDFENAVAVAEHDRVGVALAQRLADELGGGYEVLLYRIGPRHGWTTIPQTAPDN